MLPQCTIGRVGIGIEFARQFLEVEIGRQLSRVRIHAVILFGEDRYAVFALSESAAISTVPPQCNFADPLDRRCTPVLMLLPKPRQKLLRPGRRIFSRFYSASMSARCLMCRMPGIRS